MKTQMLLRFSGFLEARPSSCSFPGSTRPRDNAPGRKHSENTDFTRRTSQEPPRSPRSWRQFCSSQPPWTAMLHSGLRMAPLRELPRSLQTWRHSRSSQPPPGTARPHSGLRVTPLSWTPLSWTFEDSTKSATVSQFAYLRDGEASICFEYDTTPRGLPEAHEKGDNFAVRSPQGRRGFILVCVWHHPAGPPRNPRSWRQFRSSQPPRDGEASDLRMTPLR